MTTTDRTNRTARRARRADRRGVAMLMVIIALGAATILSGAYLASRRNTGAIGQNAVLAVRAQWASRSGLELGVAVLQTDADWRSNASDGVLIDDLDLSGAEVRVIVTNLDGMPPGPDDDDLVLTSIANVRGVESSAQRVVVAPSRASVPDALNPDLDEFGVYALGNLTVDGGGLIATWPLAKRAVLKAPVKVGLENGYASGVSIDSGATLVNAIAYAPAYASSSVRSVLDSDAFANSEYLLVMPPALLAVGTGFDSLDGGGSVKTGPPGKGAGAGAPGQAKKESKISGNFVTALAPGAYSEVEVKSNATVELTGDYSIEKLTVSNNGALKIIGDARIEIIEEAKFVDGGTIYFADNTSKATLYLRNELEVKNTALGVSPAIAKDSSRSVDSITSWSDPRRLRIYGAMIPPDPDEYSLDEEPEYDIDNNSIVLAAVHAPNAQIELDDDSVIIGRVTAGRLRIKSGCAVLADPTLDNRAGYTTQVGPLYKRVTGEPIDGLASAVASLNPDIGVEGLVDYMELHVMPEPPPATDPNYSGITLRKAVLAQSTRWPLSAMLVESTGSNGTTTINDGSLISLDASVAGLTIIDASIGGSTDSSTESSLLQSADINLLGIELQ